MGVVVCRTLFSMYYLLQAKWCVELCSPCIICCYRLLHWASTQIDPVGVDYVLQKLGFAHARVTIPKWMQRGCMDPLDKILSVLVDMLIVALRDQQEREEDQDNPS